VRRVVGAVAEPRWSPDGATLAWVAAVDGVPGLYREGRPDPDTAIGGTRSGVWAWVDAARVVVVDGDGRLVARSLGGDDDVIVRGVRGRPAALAVSPDGARVAFVDETDDACVIAVAPLDGSGSARVVSRGADYSWDPAWSPDGRWLAWHEWSFPAMPWDASRIVAADADGAHTRVVAGGDGECVGQPRFAPGGPVRLAFVSDRDGWMNVTVADPDGGQRVAIASEPHEHAELRAEAGRVRRICHRSGVQLGPLPGDEGFQPRAISPRVATRPSNRCPEDPDGAVEYDPAGHARGHHPVEAGGMRGSSTPLNPSPGRRSFSALARRARASGVSLPTIVRRQRRATRRRAWSPSCL